MQFAISFFLDILKVNGYWRQFVYGQKCCESCRSYRYCCRCDLSTAPAAHWKLPQDAKCAANSINDNKNNNNKNGRTTTTRQKAAIRKRNTFRFPFSVCNFWPVISFFLLSLLMHSAHTRTQTQKKTITKTTSKGN